MLMNMRPLIVRKGYSILSVKEDTHPRITQASPLHFKASITMHRLTHELLRDLV